jgi:hypothetical protein
MRGTYGSTQTERLVESTLACWQSYESLAGADPDLAAERQVVRADWRTIAFLGVYNAGKSSVIDCLLDQPLLPVGRFPETGAMCFVQRGPRDIVTVHRRSGTEQLPLDLATLRELMSLTRGGRRVDADRLPYMVRITCSTLPLPEGLILLDTPGLNDEDGMRERALTGARSADAVVLVATSREFLSMAEAEMLEELNRRRGLDGLVVVLNEFLDEDIEEEFLERQQDLPRYRARMADFFGALGVDASRIPLVAVSARAAAVQPERFGGPALRAAIMANPDGSWVRLVEARKRAAVRRGNAVVHEKAKTRALDLDRQFAKAEHRNREAKQAHEAATMFLAEANALVEATIGKLVDAAVAAGTSEAGNIKGAAVIRDGTYTARFRADIRLKAQAARQSLLNGLNGLILRHRQGALNTTAITLLDELAVLHDEVSISVPDSRAEARATGAATGVGAAILIPVFGWVVGGVAGAIAGNAIANSDDRDTAASRAARAGQELATKYKAKLKPLSDAVGQCVLWPEAVAAPDSASRDAWRALRDASAPAGPTAFVPFGAVLETVAA